MVRLRSRVLLFLFLMGALFCPRTTGTARAEVTAKQVQDAIDKARTALISQQNVSGSWRSVAGGDTHEVGITSLALLALLNTGMTTADPPIERGLTWLRKQSSSMTYEISLMIQALAAAKDKRDFPRVAELAALLEDMQVRQGPNTGSWTYTKGIGGDRSNGQFAVLGLREAQEMGVEVSLETWKRARNHWLTSQNDDGSWSYSGGKQHAGGTGSMTVAGIATLVITQAMMRSGAKELNADGTPNCCGDPLLDQPLEDACRWLGRNFSVRTNPSDGRWLLYYLYGLERAGRFSGRRFFVGSRNQKHDWYRDGAEYLVATQNQFSGTWKEGDQNSIVGTSFALMFLSKGLAPVLINKLQHGPRQFNPPGVGGIDWNRHADDIRNLTQYISNRPKWPRLLTWQTVDVSQATGPDLMQAPILFISGSDAPQFTPADIALFKDYILQGGFILVCNNCSRTSPFDDGFRDLVRQMYPPSEAQLKKLGADHPVFRSEFNLIENGEPTVELWGVDVGCRTSIIYSPDDLGCLWDKWTSFKVPGRPPQLVSMITKATQVGVNIVAYVTGREILDKITQQQQVLAASEPERVERDLLEIRKIRYTGDWDAAPQALKNLLIAIGRTTGAPVASRPRDLQLLDPNLFLSTPILYMHGRHDFNLSKNEQDRLRQYINQGGALFSDACCGVPAYDRSFRALMKQLFPDNPLKRIPPDHEMFTTKIGHDLKTVKRREPDVDQVNSALQVTVRTVEPFLEGIEINGRYVLVYSKYDISCALERQASVACTGYVHEDAVRIGVNVILYFLDQ